MKLFCAALLLIAAVPGLGQFPQFPPGTTQFFDARVNDAIPAAGGGVWAAAFEGIARYTAAGKGTVLTTPGGTPRRLAAATDGTIWFATSTLIGRISTSGAVLEQYAVAAVRDIAVATDGALWYLRPDDRIVRLAGGVPAVFDAGVQGWSLAAAPGGEMWVLGTGFGTGTDFLHRLSPTGAVTVLPLGYDVLFGTLQSLSDGTLFIGTGIREGVLRLRPGSSTPEEIVATGSLYFHVDPAGNLWTNRYSQLTFIGAGGTPRFTITLPRDPRDCANIPVYSYVPLAVDADGGLWLDIINSAAYIPLPPPCEEPEPPPMPDFIRIHAAALVSANSAASIPALSPAMIAALLACLGLAAIFQLRR
ncbi:MAG TPA: hypothetical protein VF266_11595 [Thermoanaerobaculia bacterium]